MFQKESRHTLGPLNLFRCANTENIYEKYARQAREGIVRKNVAELVKKMKLGKTLVKANGL
jgi:hypothetical protein